MTVRPYRWTAVREFRGRQQELGALERWWGAAAREPVSLYGRRRVGKSWLFRRFAHGKPAVILVADRTVIGQQLASLAAQLEPALAVRPQLDSVEDLFAVLYDLAKRRKILAVIDEFPYLLGTTTAEQQRTLTSIQSVMERRREDSNLRLILTGSTISQMEDLQKERNPMHGRLQPLRLGPMPFGEATLLLGERDPIEQLTRYAIAGGMPRYLRSLTGGDLAETLTNIVVNPLAPLFNEPRTALASELREPTVYFSILSQLAYHPHDVGSIAAALRMENNEVSRYLTTLEDLGLAARRRPVGSRPESRQSQWTGVDSFMRFWFRFVQPAQAELEAGADPLAHVTRNIMPHLNEHAAATFEHLVTRWVRSRATGATAVGPWWGRALDTMRREKVRTTEEIDVVALQAQQVRVVAEATWTNKPMSIDVLTNLLDYKLPALAQVGYQTTGTDIILTSKTGFNDNLRELASRTPGTSLVGAQTIVRDLQSG